MMVNMTVVMMAQVIITLEPRGYVVKGTDDAKIKINGQGKLIYVNPSYKQRFSKAELRYIDVYDLNGNFIKKLPAKSAPAKQAETTPREPAAAPTYASAPAPAPVPEPAQPTRNEPKAETRQQPKPTPKPTEATPRSSEPREATVATPVSRQSIGAEELKNAFHAYLQDIPFYNEANVSAREDIVHDHIRQLSKLDSEQKEKYARENDIQKKLTEQERELMQTRSQTEQVLENFIAGYSDYDITNKQETLDELRQMLKKRQRDWDDRLDELADASRLTYNRQTDTTGWVTVAIMLALVALLAGCGWWLYRRSRSPRHVTQPGRAPQSTAQPGGTPAGTGGENIVVRRRTTSVLKKQSLDDVVGNDSYLCIETPDFCSESAVRRIYIKNTCIKDIYNMYAEDLRNPNNPKEDGCMVLGRWVLDGASGLYDVSLEQIVKPGDDAIFAEYELNFGGKIKLRVAERLRKLRRETNLQYDLTCWVLSHPCLGVFFSNSDNNVHMQLKHPTQPYFLTAMVIDILTPDQTLGIFTFRGDGTITAQSDLTRMYSLEEMYQWAIASERSVFNPQDYFNALTGCRVRHNRCRGIELRNGAIIDIAQLSQQPDTGVVAYAQGYTRTQDNLAEYVADCVSRERRVEGKELVGCLVVATHFSFPSVRRLVSDELEHLHFVLVYSTSDDLLTSIPVVEGTMLGDESYYGENKLENLKIWTRRKR